MRKHVKIIRKIDSNKSTLALLFAFLIASVGLYTLTVSHAAPVSVATEAENGALTTKATVVSDSNASGGKAVKFSSSGGTYTCSTTSFNGYCPGPGQDYTDPNIYGSNGSNTYINTDVFNPVTNTSISLLANSPQDWKATMTIPNGNTSVVGAPQLRQDYANNNVHVPLSNFPAFYSSFAATMQQVPGVAYDAGYDLWGGNVGDSTSSFAHEMMIWTDQTNRGTCGGATKLLTTSFGGTHGVPVQNWTLCRNGPDSSNSEYIWYLSDTSGNAISEQTGSVDILAMVTYLVNHGYYPSNYGVDQLDFTNEFCSTGGQPATFTVTKLTVSAS